MNPTDAHIHGRRLNHAVICGTCVSGVAVLRALRVSVLNPFREG